MSRWLSMESAPVVFWMDGGEMRGEMDSSIVVLDPKHGPASAYSFRAMDGGIHWWERISQNIELFPTGWLRLTPPSDTDDLDAQLSPESLADVQAGRQVCRAIYTGLAEVASLESLNNQKGNDDE